VPHAVKVAGEKKFLAVFVHKAAIPLFARAKNFPSRLRVSKNVQGQPRRDVVVLLLGPRPLCPECSTGIALYPPLEILERARLEILLRRTVARRLVERFAVVFRTNPNLITPFVFE